MRKQKFFLLLFLFLIISTAVLFGTEYQKVPVKVVKVVDGDTIYVKYGELSGLKIRMLNINTPEKGKPLYAEAKTYLSNLITDKFVVLEIPLKRYKNISHGKYNRILANVYYNEIFVNAEIVRHGYSKYWTKYGVSIQSNLFLHAEREAKRKHLGVH